MSDDEENSATKLKTQPDKTSPTKLPYSDAQVTETIVGKKKRTKSKTKKTTPKKRENESSELQTYKQDNTELKNNSYKRKTRSRK